MATTQDCSVGFGRESTYGTAVTPTRWLEFTDESLDYKPGRKQGEGLRVGGRVARSGRRVTTEVMAEGGHEFEAITKGMGLRLESCFGTGTSTLVSGSTYQQVFTLGDALPSDTVQKGVPMEDGTIGRATFVGGVVAKFSFELGQGGILKLKNDLDFKGTIDTSTAYTAPSYATTPNLFHFAQAAVVFSGGTLTAPTTVALASYSSPVTPINVTDFELEIDNKLTGGPRAINGAGARTSKPRPGLREVKGKLKATYTDNTLRDAFINDTATGLILTFTTTEVLSTGFATLQIVIPEVKFNGDTPNANNGDVSEIDCDFDVLDNQSAAQPVWCVLRTADSAL